MNSTIHEQYRRGKIRVTVNKSVTNTMNSTRMNSKKIRKLFLNSGNYKMTPKVLEILK